MTKDMIKYKLLERRHLLCQEADDLEEELKFVLEEIYKIDDDLEELEEK